MTAIQELLKIVREQNGIKGDIKRSFFKWIIAGFEATNQDIQNETEKLRKENTELRNQLQDINIKYQQMHAELNNLKYDIAQIFENMHHNNEYLKALHMDTEILGQNMRNNNTVIEDLKSKIENNHVEKSVYESIDYFDFENHFRGSIEEIKQRQSIYLQYFTGKHNVLDIGCGRGEFLMLMQENNIPAIGIEMYELYVKYCKLQGLNVHHGDGLQYIETVEDSSLGGIFLGQVVEHLTPNQIVRLCELAYAKLQSNGCIVLETPNPTSLAIYTHAFYIDPSHTKPVHPLTMQYYLQKAGFKNIETIYTETSKLSCDIPALQCNENDDKKLQEFNQAMHTVSRFLFGSQDYAIVAIKE